MPQKKLTITDIAAIAQVSPSTVSMVINNRPGVAAKTRAHVLSVIKTYNFSPNLIARSLVQNRSNTVAMIVTTIENLFYPQVVRGVENTMRQRGYSLSIFSTNDDDKDEARQIDTIKVRGFDGVIHAAAHTDNLNSEALYNSGIPAVWIVRRNPRLENENFILINDIKAGYLAMEHLIRLGHTRIGIITGLKNASSAIDKLTGALMAAKDYGISMPDDYIGPGDYLLKSGYHVTQGFLRMEKTKRPTAIFSSNDQMAIGAFDALLDANLKIPEDMAIVGVNNIEAASYRALEITTIKCKKQLLGELGAKRLLELIEKKKGFKKPRQLYLEPELIIRRSCGYHMSKYVIEKKRRQLSA